MVQLYPLFADIAGRRVVVVGGGPIAEKKARSLLDAAAQVILISPQVTEQIEQWHHDGQIEVIARPYAQGDVAGAWLVIVACGQQEVNRQIHQECLERRIFCNVVDVTDLCLFQVPAICRRGPLQIAISTSGISPALARRIRLQLEEQFDPAYERFLDVLKELRADLKRRHPQDISRRSEILARLVNSPALALLRAGDIQQFNRLLEECLNTDGEQV